MRVSFLQAVHEVEREEILSACRWMRLDPDSTAYVLAKHGRPGCLLGEILAMGGNVTDFVRTTIEARPPEVPGTPRRRYR